MFSRSQRKKGAGVQRRCARCCKAPAYDDGEVTWVGSGARQQDTDASADAEAASPAAAGTNAASPATMPARPPQPLALLATPPRQYPPSPLPARETPPHIRAAPPALPPVPPPLPPQSPLTPRTCGWAGCGRELPADPAEYSKCGRCNQAFYCERQCQKRHWSRGGHKHTCAEPPSCTICLDGGNDPVPIQRGCGCRGDAGLAHVVCVAEMNAHKETGWHEGWAECPTCAQPYTGPLVLGLARNLERRLHLRPREDPCRLRADAFLGLALLNSGAVCEAEQVLLTVLAASKSVHGMGQITLAIAADLAATFGKQRKYRRMEEIQVYVHQARLRKAPGDRHTLIAAGDLAATHAALGRHREAVVLQERVAVAFARMYGAEHPKALQYTTALGSTYSTLRRSAEAAQLQSKALVVARRVHGKHHPATLLIACDLAKTYSTCGRVADAHRIQENALAEHNKRIGAGHHDALAMTMTVDLATMLAKLGKLPQAAHSLERTLPMLRTVCGQHHPSTLKAAHTLALVYQKQGKQAQAEEVLTELLPVLTRVLGARHPLTLAATADLATTFRIEGGSKIVQALALEDALLTAKEARFARWKSKFSTQTNPTPPSQDNLDVGRGLYIDVQLAKSELQYHGRLGLRPTILYQFSEQWLGNGRIAAREEFDRAFVAQRTTTTALVDPRPAAAADRAQNALAAAAAAGAVGRRANSRRREMFRRYCLTCGHVPTSTVAPAAPAGWNAGCPVL